MRHFRFSVLLLVILFSSMVSSSESRTSVSPNGFVVSGSTNSSVWNQPTLNNQIHTSEVSNVVVDGVVHSSEYAHSITFSSTRNAYMYYTIDRDTIYIAMSSRGTGWVGIGWHANEKMRGADMVLGYHDASDGSTYMLDAWGPSNVDNIAGDPVNNVLSSASSENSSGTYIEFTRHLDTGDTYDWPIIPGKTTKLILAYSYSYDDFSHIHSTALSRDGQRFYGPPSAPRSLLVSADKNQVTLSWTAPAGDGGSSLTHYNIYRSIDGVNYSKINTTTSLNYVDTSVTNGVNYNYKISVENTNGESGDSNTVSVVPVGQPTPVGNVLISAPGFTGLVTISWDYPVDDGGIPIIEYGIFRSTTMGGPYTQIGTNTSSLGYEEVVPNGFTYYYVITASNLYKSSLFSTEVNISPVGVPPSPTNIVVAVVNDNVSISFSPPTSNGGSAITGYGIYRSEIQNGPYTWIVNTSNTAYVDSNVVNNHTYFYVLTTYNSYGESAYSLEQRATIALVPDAPYNVSLVEITPSSLTISWQVPNDKGSPIQNYTVYKVSSVNGLLSLIGTATTTSFTDTDIQYGINQIYIVTATSNIGESGYSIAFSIIPSSLPSQPLNLNAQGMDSSVLLRWNKPTNEGGIFIQYYNIYRSVDNTSFSFVNSSYNREFLDEGLVNGEAVYYYVTAINELGESAPSNHSSATPNSISLALQVDVSLIRNGVHISWIDSNHLQIDQVIENHNYRVYRSTISGGPYILVDETNSTSYNDTTMQLGLLYYYVVTSINDVGESPNSNEVIIIPAAEPSKPLNLVGFAGNKQITLLWDPPELENGRPILSFNIYRSLDVNGTYEKVDEINQYYYTDESLTNNVTYYYYVTAQNELWEGSSSEKIAVTPQNANIPTDFTYTGVNPSNISQLYDETINPLVVSLTILAVIGGVSGYFGIIYFRSRRSNRSI